MTMAQLEVNCSIEIGKRTAWMKRIHSALSNTQWKRYDGTLDELKGIQSGLDHFIRQLDMAGVLKVEVTTEISADHVLNVKKNGKTFMTAKFIQYV